jgi:hypothetical protein
MHSRPLLRSSSVRVGYAIVNCVGEHSLKQIFQSELSSIRQRMIYRIVRIGVNHRAPTLRQDPAPSRPDDRTAVALTAPTADGHTHHNRAHPEDQNSSRTGCMTAASNPHDGHHRASLPSKIWTIGHRSSDSVTDSLTFWLAQSLCNGSGTALVRKPIGSRLGFQGFRRAFPQPFDRSTRPPRQLDHVTSPKGARS